MMAPRKTTVQGFHTHTHTLSSILSITMNCLVAHLKTNARQTKEKGYIMYIFYINTFISESVDHRYR